MCSEHATYQLPRDGEIKLEHLELNYYAEQKQKLSIIHRNVPQRSPVTNFHVIKEGGIFFLVNKR